MNKIFHAHEPRHEKTRFYAYAKTGADQLRSNCEADHAFVFATWIVKLIFFIDPKFQASSHFL